MIETSLKIGMFNRISYKMGQGVVMECIDEYGSCSCRNSDRVKFPTCYTEYIDERGLVGLSIKYTLAGQMVCPC